MVVAATTVANARRETNAPREGCCTADLCELEAEQRRRIARPYPSPPESPHERSIDGNGFVRSHIAVFFVQAAFCSTLISAPFGTQATSAFPGTRPVDQLRGAPSRPLRGPTHTAVHPFGLGAAACTALVVTVVPDKACASHPASALPNTSNAAAVRIERRAKRCRHAEGPNRLRFTTSYIGAMGESTNPGDPLLV